MIALTTAVYLVGFVQGIAHDQAAQCLMRYRIVHEGGPVVSVSHKGGHHVAHSDRPCDLGR